MADASGQGFTASIVNSVPNYLSSDRSTLGMVDGITGSIQYVKLVWGNSGNAYFVDDQGANPTPLPVGLNNAENYWLIDAVRDTVKDAGDGNTAVNVNIVNGSGLCFGNVNVNLGSGITIVGISGALPIGIPGASGLGVTFGKVGITSSDPFVIRNYRPAGVTESLWVTGGVYILGGLTLSGGSFDFSSGVTITGLSLASGVSLPAFIVGGTGLNVNGNVRLSGIAPGFTLPVVFTNQFGALLGTSGGTVVGMPVFGSPGATAIRTEPIGGTIDRVRGGTLDYVAVVGAVGVLSGGTVSIRGGTVDLVRMIASIAAISGGTVNIGNSIGVTVTNNLVVGGTVGIFSSSTSNTFGVVFTNNFGSPLGMSGATVFGMPVFGVSGATAIRVEIVGGISGITVSGFSFPNQFGISGGTIDLVRGGTLDRVALVNSIGFVSGGTVNIGNTVLGVTLLSAGTVNVNNKTDAEAIVMRYRSGWTDLSGVSLSKHLEGLTVNVSSLSGSGGFIIGGFTGNIMGFTGVTGLGVTFGSVSGTVKVEPGTGTLKIQGDAAQRTDAAAVGVSMIGIPGVTFTGIYGSTFSYSATTALGVSLFGVRATGGALVVSIEGGLSGITVSGFSFPNQFGISGGTIDLVRGGTLDRIGLVNSIGFVSGGSFNISNTILGVSGAIVPINRQGGAPGFGNTFAVVLTQPSGTTYANSDLGIPIVGATNATPVAVSGTLLIRGATTVAGQLGSTLGVVLLQPNGVAFTGGFTGMPIFGVTGATAVGVTFDVVSIKQLTQTAGSLGSTLGVVFVQPNGVAMTGGFTGMPIFGVTGATAIGVTFSMPKVEIFGICGGTAVPVHIVSSGICFGGGAGGVVTTSGGTIGTIASLGFVSGGNITIAPLVGSTFGFVPINQFGGLLGTSGGTVVGMPVFGSGSGATAIEATFGIVRVLGVTQTTAGGTWMRISPTEDSSGSPGVCIGPAIHVAGNATTTIGVTLNNGGLIAISRVLGVAGAQFNTSPNGVTFGVTMGLVSIRQPTSGFGSTFGVVFVQPNGQAFTGGLTGMPIFGVTGATAVGVTFGAITLGSAQLGVTFTGITFNTTRTIVVGTSFADGGGALGMPVYGVAGATSVRVQIEGGTVSGIFITEAPGITVMGVSTGIPIIGVSGGQLVGVTFTPSPISIGGLTINQILPGVTLNVTGGVFILGSSGSGSLNVSTVTTVTSLGTITNDVPVKAASSAEMPSAGKIWGITSERGIVVTEKHGSQFAIGLTLSDDFITSVQTNGMTGLGLSFGGPGTVFYFKNAPVCITKNYTGPSRNGEFNEDNFPRVPLKKGVYIQFTKWDLISHVHVGYTTGNANTYEFLKNSQILNREYQPMPLWGRILDQYKIEQNQVDIFDNGTSIAAATKQYLGVIEKPTRIFLPCKDASEIYIQPIGDYRNHTIGGGMWVYHHDGPSGATWSDTTLYERSWFASDYSAILGFQNQDIAGGRPDLGITGNSLGPITSNPPIIGFAGTAAGQILQSYKFNPFVRIWGY